MFIKYHKILIKFTSNRDKFFTSNYEKIVILLIKIRVKLYIIY